MPAYYGGLQIDRGVSVFDRRHRATITYLYDLPWMKNQQGFLGQVVGGWRIGGVTTFESV